MIREQIFQMFVDPLPQPINGKRTYEFPNVDYKLLKLFILSILWRTSASSLDAYRLVSLGPHEEIIRQMILSNAHVDVETYPCLVFILFGGDRHLNDVMPDPTLHREQGLRCYRFVVRGFMYFIYIGNHQVNLGGSPLFLGRTPNVRVSSGNWDEFKFLKVSMLEVASIPD
jgi:hypothetical protein